jgi:hypothetical protein
MQKMTALKADFDREGRVKGNLLASLLRLGGGSAREGLVRWVVAVAAAVGVRQMLDRRSKL